MVDTHDLGKFYEEIYNEAYIRYRNHILRKVTQDIRPSESLEYWVFKVTVERLENIEELE